jgi:hypothetical protein
MPPTAGTMDALAHEATEAAKFVRTLRTAEQLEQKDKIGSSLA